MVWRSLRVFPPTAQNPVKYKILPTGRCGSQLKTIRACRQAPPAITARQLHFCSLGEASAIFQHPITAGYKVAVPDVELLGQSRALKKSVGRRVLQHALLTRARRRCDGALAVNRDLQRQRLRGVRLVVTALGLKRAHTLG